MTGFINASKRALGNPSVGLISKCRIMCGETKYWSSNLATLDDEFHLHIERKRCGSVLPFFT